VPAGKVELAEAQICVETSTGRQGVDHDADAAGRGLYHEWGARRAPLQGAPAAAARGSAKGEDKDSLTFTSRKAVGRLAR